MIRDIWLKRFVNRLAAHGYDLTEEKADWARYEHEYETLGRDYPNDPEGAADKQVEFWEDAGAEFEIGSSPPMHLKPWLENA